MQNGDCTLWTGHQNCTTITDTIGPASVAQLAKKKKKKEEKIISSRQVGYNIDTQNAYKHQIIITAYRRLPESFYKLSMLATYNT